MKVEYSGIQLILAHWITSDKQLWKNLKGGFIKLINQRLIKGYSFKEIARINQLEEIKVRKMFEAALLIIERLHGKKIADFLREMNDAIETKRDLSVIGKGGFEFNTIWLN